MCQPKMALSIYQNLFDELDDIFHRSWMHFPTIGSAFEQQYARQLPSLVNARYHPMDVVESEKSYEIRVDVPGMTQENVNVELKDGYLSIEGKREKTNGSGNLRIERQSTSFSRSVKLPDNVDKENIVAKLDMGVLSVTLPKTTSKSSRSVKINVT